MVALKAQEFSHHSPPLPGASGTIVMKASACSNVPIGGVNLTLNVLDLNLSAGYLTWNRPVIVSTTTAACPPARSLMVGNLPIKYPWVGGMTLFPREVANLAAFARLVLTLDKAQYLYSLGGVTHLHVSKSSLERMQWGACRISPGLLATVVTPFQVSRRYRFLGGTKPSGLPVL